MTLHVDQPRERDILARCGDCGLTLHAGAAFHDQALVLASVCPRCDGTLIDTRRAPARPSWAEPSIYLG